MFREQAIRLRVGEPNPTLDALLAREGQEIAACVRGDRSLVEALEEEGYAGAGDGSVLIVGMPRRKARELGRRLGKRAVIFHQRGERTELVFAG